MSNSDKKKIPITQTMPVALSGPTMLRHGGTLPLLSGWCNKKSPPQVACRKPKWPILASWCVVVLLLLCHCCGVSLSCCRGVLLLWYIVMVVRPH